MKTRKELINEATVNDLGKQEPETVRGETITDVLDHCSKEARQFYKQLDSIVKRSGKLPGAVQTNKYNPLFVGPTGAGKTSIIKTWARDKGYEIVTINMMGDALDFLGVKTIDREAEIPTETGVIRGPRVSTVATKAFDVFLTGSTKVLFLDEINKTNPRILQALYDLISFHIVQNGDEVMSLPKLLFTVGAMNPSEYGGGREQLDPALKARMVIYEVQYDTIGLRDYLSATLQALIDDAAQNIEELKNKENPTEDDKADLEDWADIYAKQVGRKALVDAVFEKPAKFRWTSAEQISNASELDQVLVPRTFETAVFNCNGTKADFLKWVLKDCGPEAATMIQDILSGYNDKEHIANKIWEKDWAPKAEEEKPEEVSAEEKIASETDAEEAGGLKQSMFDRLARARRGM